MSYLSDIPPSWLAEDFSNLDLINTQHNDRAGSLTPSNRHHSMESTDTPRQSAGDQVRRSGKTFLKRKVIFDRVHGELVFPPVLCLLIDTPIVQRLRDLKQLGNASYVYPSATITRFEHSLGVSHLAMKFLKQILENHKDAGGVPCALPKYEEEEITKDVWCVGIAGLCHDLGHGPLSHMFEHYVNMIRKREGKAEWCHEDASIRLMERLWSDKRDQLEDAGLLEADLQFVKLCMRGLAPGDPWPQNVGRPAWKRFMVEIVANKRNDLDVDKLDYLQRDCLCCLGMPALTSLDRLFLGACAAQRRTTTGASQEEKYVPLSAGSEDEWQICYERKLYVTIEEVFLARARLHHTVYQHRVTRVVDQMLTDAFLLADPYLRVTHSGRSSRLSETVDDVDLYIQTGDWVVSAILNSTMPELNPAKAILANIQNRHLYSTIGSYSTSSNVGKQAITAEKLMLFIKDAKLKERLTLWEDEHKLASLVVLDVKITKAPIIRKQHDKNSANPLDSIVFFNPSEVGSRCVVQAVKGQVTFSCGVRNQNMFIFVSRMKCTPTERDILSEAWRTLSIENKVDNAVPRPSPLRSGMRGQEDEDSAPLALSSTGWRPQHSAKEFKKLHYSQEEALLKEDEEEEEACVVAPFLPPPPILRSGIADHEKKRPREE